MNLSAVITPQQLLVERCSGQGQFCASSRRSKLSSWASLACPSMY
jgi:hypothetical protein